MITFFGNPSKTIFAVQTSRHLSQDYLNRLTWLFGDAPQIPTSLLSGHFIGPRAAMITPWSTNAVEITQNMAISGITRIERFVAVDSEDQQYDRMLSQLYRGLDQEVFAIDVLPEPILKIVDIATYNEAEGLSLSAKEVAYLEALANRMGRPLTDSEVFGFSQVNSEHCRHKIFNGRFIIDGQIKNESLFSLIKKTSKIHPRGLVSAYKDNVAFVQGPTIDQFAPERPDVPSSYKKESFQSVLSLKAETHNFPTTVEPFNGAATGSGGEIRDRMAGGRGSIPLAGTAIYMTSYPRISKNRPWEQAMQARPWLYQTPVDILIKASNGASDFGNKFGQPLISGSLLTFEHEARGRKLGFDKVIMLAGGVGYARAAQAVKDEPKPDDRIVILGGDNYRIGMGGAAVSSADTGAFSAGIELNAVQRSNPEMQKRVANTIRSLVESGDNIIVSIHDHGAGGHLNCLSELVEETGGTIEIDKLPLGDPTLSAKEIIGNESQERMGLVVARDDISLLQRVAHRERSPIYDVGQVTGDDRFIFQSSNSSVRPMDLALTDMFGSSPQTIMRDQTVDRTYDAVTYRIEDLAVYIEQVLRIEAVACKDWLTNKVDRCVGGLVAKQQCTGPLQLPLNNCGVMALDYTDVNGIATSVGHAPVSGLIDPGIGSRNAVAEALTNLIWAPLEEGIQSVSLSANWMWPCNNEGEDARLYAAVEALSDFAIELGLNVPTGKDSLSMKQKYPNDEVLAPGTVVVSTVGACSNINQVIEPVLQRNKGDIYYINLSQGAFELGGSSFAQTQARVGEQAPDVVDASFFARAFDTVQNLIESGLIAAGHDISAGGMLTALLEMCFADQDLGASIDLSPLNINDTIKLFFAENAGIIFQANDDVEQLLDESNIQYFHIGKVVEGGELNVTNFGFQHSFNIEKLRDIWYETSFLLDDKQTANDLASARFKNYKDQVLHFVFPEKYAHQVHKSAFNRPKPLAAVIREKGSNSERELAHALYLAGFEVRDVHMTDLIEGREDLTQVRMLGAVGGFSNSDVLGSAKGWAGAFTYNEKANRALMEFFRREDVLSIGICNGCQLFIELDLINPEHELKAHMGFNKSFKHESGFTSVNIPDNNSVFLASLAGSRLGVWISHGEGNFELPLAEDQYNIVAKYGYNTYPANPNGSDYSTAMMSSWDGRHLVTMPHIERSIFSWNWAHYPSDRKGEVSPWLQAFINARKWLEEH